MSNVISGYRKEIWIIGSSIILNAADHARIRPIGYNLGFDKYGCQVVWIGVSGMKWHHLVGSLTSMIRFRGTIPSVLVMHCGANDIGETPQGALLHHMKFVVAIISNMIPDTSIVWSSLLPRLEWRYSSNHSAMEETRKRVNRGMRSYLTKYGGYVIKYPDFDDRYCGLFKKDGVHLSFIGLDIFLNQIQCAIETFIKYPYCLVFPFK